jgi:hypothetical protein
MTAMRNSNAKHIDFGFMQGIFPNPRELPVNIDMIMEKNNKFIIGEWKKPSEKISLGQEIMLKNLAKRDNIIVLIIEGNSDDEECYVNKVEQLHTDGSRELLGEGKQFLLDLFSAWHKQARG